MKLKDLFEEYQEPVLESENEDETPDKAPPSGGKMGELITTAQAARELGVSMGRIRQMIADKELQDYAGPEPGRRDHLLKLADVQAKKAKPKDKGGRPEGS